jgi:hypothetical protein
MFDAWAETAGVRLQPGTVYLCSNTPVAFPSSFISLDPFEHLHSVAFRRKQRGYSPRLHPISVANSFLAWVYRWSADDVALGFNGGFSDCGANRLLEVIAPIHFKNGLGNPVLTISFLGQ